MTDEYTKTIVIRDPAYRPGELYPGKKPAAPAGESTVNGDNDTVSPNYPSFEDTSWLT